MLITQPRKTVKENTKDNTQSGLYQRSGNEQECSADIANGENRMAFFPVCNVFQKEKRVSVFFSYNTIGQLQLTRQGRANDGQISRNKKRRR